ncbi:MAG TPA: succinate dehydrogenase/fumarate reductase cytochrome b subunit, partial [Shewanella sp.]|nr:succinate dehydrogenase/fumarate reductase cytochrome b subunit [Shewanella sp.]
TASLVSYLFIGSELDIPAQPFVPE